MAIVRMTAAEAKRRAKVDHAKVEATTEEDIRRHMVEDGFDPDEPFKGLREVVPVASIRRRLNMTQAAFAKALGIPPATLRNWEQGRRVIDPVAVSFFALVNDDPERAFRVLATK